MKSDFDIIVIGAGIVGVSTAIHLQKQGLAVLLLDKKGIAEETSYGNSGVLDTGYALPFAPPNLMKAPQILLGQESSARIAVPSGLKYVPWIANYYYQSIKANRIRNGLHMRPLIENAVEEHKELLKDTQGIKYLKDYGRAKIYRSEQSFQAAQSELELLKQCGVTCRVFGAEEFCEQEPDIKPVFYKAVTCESSGRYTSPHKAIQAMANKFKEQGGKIKHDYVSDLVSNGDAWSVNQNYNAKRVVICAGPWSNQILKPLGHRFPIAMKRGYHQHFTSSAQLSYALVDVDPGYLICPMEQGIRITTGVEFAGRDAPANPVQIKQVLPKAQELIELDNSSEDDVWLGARPCMADSLPVIGESKTHKGLWFNLGHGHVGLTAGPASGKLLAQMMSGQKTFCDPAPYNPYRF